MLTEKSLKVGLTILLGVLETTFLRQVEAKELEWQRRVHEEDPDVAAPDNPGQYTNPDGSFKPNKDQARDRAKTTIQMGVGRRLEGAIALYGIGEQMECVRHIILALDSVFCILEWEEASAWCNEQNRVLFEAYKRKQAA
jgi:hypothetical protein